MPQVFTFFNRDPKRLFDQNMFACRERLADQRYMKAIMHRNDD